jgi:hypothetical protein
LSDTADLLRAIAGAFRRAVERLLGCQPVGYAMADLNDRYNYIVLGDPGAGLRIDRP